ncbi:MAG TPA: hypothetical protein DDY89_19520 [Lysinibacillus sp.]|nr:hypothetical protein [Lysinibacillus sp.]
MKEIFDFLNEYKQLMVFVFSLFGLRSFFTFISSKPLERQLFSKENKIIYELLNVFTVFILLPTVMFYILSKDQNTIVNVINRNFGYSFLLYSLVFVFLNLRKLLSIKWFKRFALKIKIYKFLSNSKLETTFAFLYIILSMIIFGAINSSIFMEISGLKYRILGLSILIFIELYIIYISLYMGTNFKFTKAMMVEIKMDNGDIYKNYYIYNPSKNFILIGKEKDPLLCKEPILIQINKILSCKQVDIIIEVKYFK